jgi:hypothetical protein
MSCVVVEAVLLTGGGEHSIVVRRFCNIKAVAEAVEQAQHEIFSYIDKEFGCAS